MKVGDSLSCKCGAVTGRDRVHSGEHIDPHRYRWLVYESPGFADPWRWISHWIDHAINVAGATG